MYVRYGGRRAKQDRKNLSYVLTTRQREPAAPQAADDAIEYCALRRASGAATFRGHVRLHRQVAQHDIDAAGVLEDAPR
jgi:hypothetical protein